MEDITTGVEGGVRAGGQGQETQDTKMAGWRWGKGTEDRERRKGYGGSTKWKRSGRGEKRYR